MKKCLIQSIQSMLNGLLYIFPIFQAINEYHSSKKAFLIAANHSSSQFFEIFLWTKALLSKCVTHRCKQVVIGRSQASKLRGVELSSWVFPTHREPVLPYVMVDFHAEKWRSAVSNLHFIFVWAAKPWRDCRYYNWPIWIVCCLKKVRISKEAAQSSFSS